MTDYITIGSSPTEEDCAQVGSPDYQERSRNECKAFIAQLARVFGLPPEGARLTAKSFPHDFGSYREVVCYYDEEKPESAVYAFKLESNTPEKWDEEARTELGL